VRRSSGTTVARVARRGRLGVVGGGWANGGRGGLGGGGWGGGGGGGGGAYVVATMSAGAGVKSTNGSLPGRASMTAAPEEKRHGTAAAIAAPFGTPRAAARARVPAVCAAPLRAVHRRAACRATVARSELIRPSMVPKRPALNAVRGRVAHP